MYLEFYGLRAFPFSLTPDPRLFFAYGHYQDVLNNLKIALNSGEEVLKVTGEAGSGKTLLCRKLLNDLNSSHHTIYIPNPMLTSESLVRTIADELGVDTQSITKQHQRIKRIIYMLIKKSMGEQKKGVLLCIDEAQSMPLETLAMIGLLTNLESKKRRLLQVVLFGQPELDEKLDHRSIRQIKQRITLSCRLEPLDQQGTAAYISHRLSAAGSSGLVQFHPKALKWLQRGGRGSPLLINTLAHKSLMLGFGQGTMTITHRHVQSAINDTEGAIRPRLWYRLADRLFSRGDPEQESKILNGPEDRNENAIKGQDSITSHTRDDVHSGLTPASLFALLSSTLLSATLLSAVIYLLWGAQNRLTTAPPPRSTLPEATTPPRPDTIASRVTKFDNTRATAKPPSVATQATIVEPGKRGSAPEKPVAIVQQPHNTIARPTPAAPVKPKMVADVEPAPTRPATSISEIIPAKLRGSWQPQRLTIVGENLLPDSSVLVCWTTKCDTLSGHRVKYTSHNELNIDITTGTKEANWRLIVINPDGTKSNTKVFAVRSPVVIAKPKPKPTPTPKLAEPLGVVSTPPADDESPQKTAKASTISKKIIPLTDHQKAEAYYLKANRLAQERRIAQAVILWEKAIVLAPEHHASRRALIENLITLNRIVEAKGYIVQAFKLFPNHPVYVQKRAQIYLLQGDAQSAIELINESVERGVASADLFAFVAALYQRKKDHLKSIANYQRALNLNPDHGVWWMGLGISFLHSKKYQEALAALQRARTSGSLSPRLMSYVSEQIVKIRDQMESKK